MASHLFRSALLRRLAAGLAIGGLATTAAVLIARPDGGPAQVTTDAGIKSALAKAGAGSTIRIAPGRYGAIVIGKRQGPLTIMSADPRNPAVFAAITIGSSSDITLRDLTIERQANEPVRAFLVMVRNSNGVLLENLRVNGPGGEERGREYGIMMRDGSDLRVAGSHVSGVRYGIGMLNSRKVAIEGNTLRELQTDGIRGGGIDDLLIAGNVLGRFRPKPRDHPDGIQLWSTNQKVAAKQIVIRDNLVARDGGGITQGIFVRDTASKLPFEGTEIRGNLAIGTMYNGIALLGAIDPVVTDNEVIAFPDQKSWIRLQAIRGGELTANRAMQYIEQNNVGLRETGNKTTRPVTGDVSPRIRAWLDARPGLKATAGPYLRELARIDAQRSGTSR